MPDMSADETAAMMRTRQEAANAAADSIATSSESPESIAAEEREYETKAAELKARFAERQAWLTRAKRDRYWGGTFRDVDMAPPADPFTFQSGLAITPMGGDPARAMEGASAASERQRRREMFAEWYGTQEQRYARGVADIEERRQARNVVAGMQLEDARTAAQSEVQRVASGIERGVRGYSLEAAGAYFTDEGTYTPGRTWLENIQRDVYRAAGQEFSKAAAEEKTQTALAAVKSGAYTNIEDALRGRPVVESGAAMSTQPRSVQQLAKELGGQYNPETRWATGKNTLREGEFSAYSPYGRIFGNDRKTIGRLAFSTRPEFKAWREAREAEGAARPGEAGYSDVPLMGSQELLMWSMAQQTPEKRREYIESLVDEGSPIYTPTIDREPGATYSMNEFAFGVVDAEGNRIPFKKEGTYTPAIANKEFTIWTTEKGAWAMIDRRGQVAEHGSAGSFDVMISRRAFSEEDAYPSTLPWGRETADGSIVIGINPAMNVEHLPPRDRYLMLIKETNRFYGGRKQDVEFLAMSDKPEAVAWRKERVAEGPRDVGDAGYEGIPMGTWYDSVKGIAGLSSQNLAGILKKSSTPGQTEAYAPSVEPETGAQVSMNEFAFGVFDESGNRIPWKKEGTYSPLVLNEKFTIWATPTGAWLKVGKSRQVEAHGSAGSLYPMLQQGAYQSPLGGFSPYSPHMPAGYGAVLSTMRYYDDFGTLYVDTEYQDIDAAGQFVPVTRREYVTPTPTEAKQRALNLQMVTANEKTTWRETRMKRSHYDRAQVIKEDLRDAFDATGGPFAPGKLASMAEAYSRGDVFGMVMAGSALPKYLKAKGTLIEAAGADLEQYVTGDTHVYKEPKTFLQMAVNEATGHPIRNVAFAAELYAIGPAFELLPTKVVWAGLGAGVGATGYSVATAPPEQRKEVAATAVVELAIGAAVMGPSMYRGAVRAYGSPKVWPGKAASWTRVKFDEVTLGGTIVEQSYPDMTSPWPVPRTPAEVAARQAQIDYLVSESLPGTRSLYQSLVADAEENIIGVMRSTKTGAVRQLTDPHFTVVQRDPYFVQGDFSDRVLGLVEVGEARIGTAHTHTTVPLGDSVPAGDQLHTAFKMEYLKGAQRFEKSAPTPADYRMFLLQNAFREDTLTIESHFRLTPGTPVTNDAALNSRIEDMFIHGAKVGERKYLNKLKSRGLTRDDPKALDILAEMSDEVPAFQEVGTLGNKASDFMLASEVGDDVLRDVVRGAHASGAKGRAHVLEVIQEGYSTYLMRDVVPVKQRVAGALHRVGARSTESPANLLSEKELAALGRSEHDASLDVARWAGINVEESESWPVVQKIMEDRGIPIQQRGVWYEGELHPWERTQMEFAPRKSVPISDRIAGVSKRISHTLRGSPRRGTTPLQFTQEGLPSDVWIDVETGRVTALTPDYKSVSVSGKTRTVAGSVKRGQIEFVEAHEGGFTNVDVTQIDATGRSLKDLQFLDRAIRIQQADMYYTDSPMWETSGYPGRTIRGILKMHLEPTAPPNTVFRKPSSAWPQRMLTGTEPTRPLLLTGPEPLLMLPEPAPSVSRLDRAIMKGWESYRGQNTPADRYNVIHLGGRFQDAFPVREPRLALPMPAKDQALLRWAQGWYHDTGPTIRLPGEFMGEYYSFDVHMGRPPLQDLVFAVEPKTPKPTPLLPGPEPRPLLPAPKESPLLLEEFASSTLEAETLGAFPTQMELFGEVMPSGTPEGYFWKQPVGPAPPSPKPQPTSTSTGGDSSLVLETKPSVVELKAPVEQPAVDAPVQKPTPPEEIMIGDITARARKDAGSVFKGLLQTRTAKEPPRVRGRTMWLNRASAYPFVSQQDTWDVLSEGSAAPMASQNKMKMNEIAGDRRGLSFIPLIIGESKQREASDRVSTQRVGQTPGVDVTQLVRVTPMVGRTPTFEPGIKIDTVVRTRTEPIRQPVSTTRQDQQLRRVQEEQLIRTPRHPPPPFGVLAFKEPKPKERYGDIRYAHYRERIAPVATFGEAFLVGPHKPGKVHLPTVSKMFVETSGDYRGDIAPMRLEEMTTVQKGRSAPPWDISVSPKRRRKEQNPFDMGGVLL